MAEHALTRREAGGLAGLAATGPTLNLDRKAVVAYAHWTRWMLGIDSPPPGYPTSMTVADAMLHDPAQRQAIYAVARELWRGMGPFIWKDAAGAPVQTHEVYRGVRLSDPDLDGKVFDITADSYYGDNPSSWTEDQKVACYFADPGSKGMPAIALGNQPPLPPHGYVLVATVNARDVLFHHRYLLGAAFIFGMRDPLSEASTTFLQREVTLKGGAAPLTRAYAFHDACGDYVKMRYGGAWEAGDPDPFGPGWVG